MGFNSGFKGLSTASAGLQFDVQYYSFTLPHTLVTTTLVYNDAIFLVPSMTS